jgi:hypothetical protein
MAKGAYGDAGEGTLLALSGPHDPALAPSISKASARRSGRHRRFAGALALAALVAVALTLASGEWGVPFGGGSSGGSLAHYGGPGFSFSYPAGWHSSGGWVGTMGLGAMVYLSTDRLQRSCKTLHHANGQITGSRCGGEVALPGILSPGGVLVAWTTDYGPGGGFSHLPGSRTRLGGHPARITVNQGNCSPVWEASESLSASVATSTAGGNGGWYQMDACMRGPGLSQAKAQVRAMLRSVSFKPTQ